MLYISRSTFVFFQFSQEVTYLSGSSTGPSKVKVCVQAKEWPWLNIGENGMKQMAVGCLAYGVR